MSDTPKKPVFEWKEGETLTEKDFSPLGDIRAHGLPKINKALAQDPKRRKEERERYLAQTQSQPYKNAKTDLPDNLIVEEEVSGLSGKFDDGDEYKRLTGQDAPNKRTFNRFGPNK